MIPLVSTLTVEEQQAWLASLSKQMPERSFGLFSELSQTQKSTCEFAIVANPDPNDLADLPKLKWVQSLWAGVERMIAELPEASFKIVRLVDPHLAETMSEAVLAWTLFLHRDMPYYARQQSQATWQPRPMVRACERRVGILGLGELGKASALRLVENGFSVSGWSRQAKQISDVTCLHGEQGMQQLLESSDILVCLLPLTTATHFLLNEQTLSLLPAGASLINFARGAVVDDSALKSKLDQGHLSHAVLDVFQQEPLASDNDYWQRHNVTVLPHISAPTHRVSACQVVAKNLEYYQHTGQIPTAVDMTRGY